MKIRRYFGHDCDSINGFNNGYYIDDEPIQCADYAEAERLCIEAAKEYIGEGPYENDNNTEMPIIQVTTGYYDDQGNEVTAERFSELNENEECGSYRYQYISAEKTEE